MTPTVRAAAPTGVAFATVFATSFLVALQLSVATGGEQPPQSDPRRTGPDALQRALHGLSRSAWRRRIRTRSDQSSLALRTNRMPTSTGSFATANQTRRCQASGQKSRPGSRRARPVAAGVSASAPIQPTTSAMAPPIKVSPERLRRASEDPANWLMYGGDYGQTRFSALAGINDPPSRISCRSGASRQACLTA